MREEMESKVAEIATSFWSKFAREKVIRLGERDILWKYGSPILELNEGGLDDPKAVVLRTRRTLLLSTDLEEHIALYHAFVEGGEQIKEAVEEACVSKHTLFLGWDFRRQCPSLTRYLSED